MWVSFDLTCTSSVIGRTMCQIFSFLIKKYQFQKKCRTAPAIPGLFNNIKGPEDRNKITTSTSLIVVVKNKDMFISFPRSCRCRPLAENDIFSKKIIGSEVLWETLYILKTSNVTLMFVTDLPWSNSNFLHNPPTWKSLTLYRYNFRINRAISYLFWIYHPSFNGLGIRAFQRFLKISLVIYFIS